MSDRRTNTLRRTVVSAAGAMGLALHAALRPNASALETPQAQTVPDRDYEGVKRAKGGAFQPADEVREDAWAVQSRSSADATRFFYGADEKRGGDTAAVDLGHGRAGETSVDPRYADTGPEQLAAASAANDAAWEQRRQRLAASGRLHGERPRSDGERARDAGLSDAHYAATVREPGEHPHTCTGDPASWPACRGCHP